MKNEGCNDIELVQAFHSPVGSPLQKCSSEMAWHVHVRSMSTQSLGETVCTVFSFGFRESSRAFGMQAPAQFVWNRWIVQSDNSIFESNTVHQSKHPKSYIWRSWSQDGPRWACKVTSFFLKSGCFRGTTLLRNMHIVSDHAWQIVFFCWGANDCTPTADNYEATAHKKLQCPILSLNIIHIVFTLPHMSLMPFLKYFLFEYEAWKLDVLDLLFMVGTWVCWVEEQTLMYCHQIVYDCYRFSHYLKAFKHIVVSRRYGIVYRYYYMCKWYMMCIYHTSICIHLYIIIYIYIHIFLYLCIHRNVSRILPVEPVEPSPVCSEAPGVGRSTLPKPEPLQHQAHEWNAEVPLTELDI